MDILIGVSIFNDVGSYRRESLVSLPKNELILPIPYFPIGFGQWVLGYSFDNLARMGKNEPISAGPARSTTMSNVGVPCSSSSLIGELPCLWR